MTTGEWQKRLVDTFSRNGVVGADLLPVFDTEAELGSHYTNTFKGHAVLADSFMGFFAHTLQKTLLSVGSDGWPKKKLNYRLTLAYFLQLFRRFRACEILAPKGYPLDAYSLMRDLKDRAMALCAVARNISTLPNVLGTLPPPVPQDRLEYGKKSLRRRKDDC